MKNQGIFYSYLYYRLIVLQNHFEHISICLGSHVDLLIVFFQLVQHKEILQIRDNMNKTNREYIKDKKVNIFSFINSDRRRISCSYHKYFIVNNNYWPTVLFNMSVVAYLIYIMHIEYNTQFKVINLTFIGKRFVKIFFLNISFILKICIIVFQRIFVIFITCFPIKIITISFIEHWNSSLANLLIIWSKIKWKLLKTKMLHFNAPKCV